MFKKRNQRFLSKFSQKSIIFKKKSKFWKTELVEREMKFSGFIKEKNSPKPSKTSIQKNNCSETSLAFGSWVGSQKGYLETNSKLSDLVKNLFHED